MKKLNNLIALLGQIKDLPRSGWLCKKVENPETVADHSLGLALLVLLFTPDNLDRDKCLRLAVVHDLAEAKIGDFTPFDDISREEKRRLEQRAQAEVVQELVQMELAELFKEYEENTTAEARFVHDLDRLEAVLQAKYYEDNNRAAENLLPEFIGYASKHLNDEKGVAAKLINILKQSEGL